MGTEQFSKTPEFAAVLKKTVNQYSGKFNKDTEISHLADIIE